MKSRWSDRKASEFVSKYGKEWGRDLALRTYTCRLIGIEHVLVLHGGGNTSVKGTVTNLFGEEVPAVFVKASGYDLMSLEPDGHAMLELGRLQRLRDLSSLSDAEMANQLRTALFDAKAPSPSIEALLHAFLPPIYVDHTHADSILALTNQPDGERVVRDALGDNVIVLGYVKPGFKLAKAAAQAFADAPRSEGMVLMKHGLITWGEFAQTSYERTVSLVTRAERYLARHCESPLKTKAKTPLARAKKRYQKVAPVLRGLLSVPTGDSDRPHKRFILLPLITREVLDVIDSTRGKQIAVSPPLTSDHLIRTKPLPLWIGGPRFDDEDKLRSQLSVSIKEYEDQYNAYFNRYTGKAKEAQFRLDSKPRVILMPGMGAVCAGRNIEEAAIVRDIAAHTLEVKAKIASFGSYEGLSDKNLFEMEYLPAQHAKLDKSEKPLERAIALVTGAAGAIGSGICEELLKKGCHVAATDLPGKHLDGLVHELKKSYGNRVMNIPLDVTDSKSVSKGFDRVILRWGGIDLVIPNAGLAHVASLEELDADTFRKIERVNVEGTLNILAEAARRFKVQGTGGDIVLVSTKNVFAPGAKFGAYSATKAAAHQLARIATLEMAELGVRVNMVSPDAVFSHGKRKSGLWAEVGPDRMKARGLDEKGLEDYYRDRNLLKVRVTATHVAKAVLFFATRQTPTTGVTLPVDGGLPDATPR